MIEHFQQKCINCESNYISDKLYEIIEEDLGLCPICLDEKMRNNEIPPFTEEQIEKITTHAREGFTNQYHQERQEDGLLTNDSSVKIDNKEYLANEKEFGYGVNLNNLVKERENEKLIGRDKEIEKILMILSRKYKSNPVIIGEPGVGKTAIVNGIAKRLVENRAPKNLLNKKIVEISVAELLSGTKYRGELEQKITHIMTSAQNRGDIILFFDEIHALMDVGGSEGTVNAVNIIKPYLTRGDVQIIGATTEEEYRKSISPDSAFSRRLQVVDLKEPSPEETIKIINGIKSEFERHHKVIIEDEAVAHAVTLANRYLTELYQPDKTIDLIDEAAALKKITKKEIDEELMELEERLIKTILKKDKHIQKDEFEEAKKELDKEQVIKKELEQKRKALQIEESKNAIIGKAEINAILEKRTGIPTSQLNKDDKARIVHLKENLQKRIKGQEKAVEEVARFMKRSRLNLKDPKRPNGVFLFLGSTGVGKTELAKVLGEELFGSSNLIRIDMSEFMEKHNVSKLIGTPPGYIGYEEGGKLTNLLRRNPHSIVLFDEVEKAHPDVFNIMLQMFEDGIITDNRGKTVDVKNATFILTSNAGSEAYTEKSLGFSSASNEDRNKETAERVLAKVREEKIFRPEFLNRVDSIVVFNELTETAINEIATVLTDDFTERMKKEGYNVSFTNKAVQLLAKEGYKPEFGARELKRKVENTADLLTDAILENEKDKYTITEKDGKLIVK